MHQLGILFDIDALGGGFYGPAAYRIFFAAVDSRTIPGALLRDGDTNATLRGRERHYCIAVASASQDHIEHVRKVMSACEADGLLPLAQRFLETAAVAGEPLVLAGPVNAAGEFLAEGFPQHAWQETRAQHTQPAAAALPAAETRPAAAPSAASGEPATVSYRDTALLATPQGDRDPVALLQRGDHVTVLSREGDLARVQTATGLEGWVAQIALRSAQPTSAGMVSPSPVSPSVVVLQPAAPQPVRYRDLPAPHCDRSRELAAALSGVLQTLMAVQGGYLGALGVMFLAAIMLSEGLWQLGAIVYAGLSLAALVILVVVVVRMCLWIYRTVHATRELGVRPLMTPPALAVLLCFVPLVNIFWFYAVLGLFWSATDLSFVRSDARRDRFTMRIPGVFGLNVLGTALSLLGLVALGAAGDAGGLVAGVFLTGIAVIASLGAIAVLRSIIEDISYRLYQQHDTLRRLPAEPPAQSPAAYAVTASGA